MRPDVNKMHVHFKLNNMLHAFIDSIGQEGLLVNPLVHIHVHQYPKDFDVLDSSNVPYRRKGSISSGFWPILVEDRKLVVFR